MHSPKRLSAGQQAIDANLNAPHSPEPWFHTKQEFVGVVADYDYDGPDVEMHSAAMPTVSYYMGTLTPANARRACACVNFMAGTPTEAIEAWVEKGLRFTKREGV